MDWVVILYATDRLARKVSVGEILLDEMFDYGVQLHIIAWNAHVRNTPEDKLRFNFESTFSGFERDKIIQRTTSGKLKKAADNHLIGNTRPRFGYQMNEYKNNWLLSEYAPVAREVLVSYGICRENPVAIARRMQEKGYKTPGVIRCEDRIAANTKKYEAGRFTTEQFEEKLAAVRRLMGQERWTDKTVHGIVCNYRIYAGTFTYKLAGQTFSVAVPPIITEEEAADTERMLALGRNRFARKEETRHQHLMARRLSCAACNHTYYATYNQLGYTYYRCGFQRYRASWKCEARPVRRDDVDALARVFVRDLLLDTNRLFAWWQAQSEEEAASHEVLEHQIADLEARIAVTKEKLHRILDRLTDILDADELAYYSQQREYLKNLLTEYREDRDELNKKRAASVVDETVIVEFAQLGQAYKETLETSEDFSFWRGLVDDLDMTGIIGTEEDGRRYVDFVVFGRVRRRGYLPGGVEDRTESASTATTEATSTWAIRST